MLIKRKIITEANDGMEIIATAIYENPNYIRAKNGSLKQVVNASYYWCGKRYTSLENLKAGKSE